MGLLQPTNTKKHTSHTSQDFKPDIISQRQITELEETIDFETSEEDAHSGANYNVISTNAQYEEDDGCSVIIEYIAALSHFEKNNQAIDDSIVTSLVEELCVSNSLSTALSRGGPSSSSFKRHQYYNEKFKVVEPVEYILEPKEKRSYQYIPIHEFLIQILGKENITDQLLSKAPQNYK